MKASKRIGQVLTKVGVVVALCTGSSQAGTFDINFDDLSNPVFNDIVISGSGELRATGGNGDPTTSGYLKVTDNVNSQRGTLIFPDLEAGQVVGAFRIEADLRVGGGTDRPADGFSFNFVRSSGNLVDPVLSGGAFAGTRDIGGSEDNLPEEGTQTGIAIGFDEWTSGGTDVEGISVRVDGVMVAQEAFPTRNGDVTDDTSLQTGPSGAFLEVDDSVTAEFDVTSLGWARLVIDKDEANRLIITYKGREVYNDVLGSYLPHAGQLVFAGRTGGANAMHHIDNILIQTTAATEATLSSLSGNGFGFIAELTDTVDSIIDETQPITVTLDGNPVTVGVSKTGPVTTLTYSTMPPALLAAGDHEIVVDAKDTGGNDFSKTATLVIAPYFLLDPAWAAGPGVVDTGTTGFLARMHQIGVGRGPGDANSILNAERQLADQFIDDLTGAPQENLVETTLAPLPVSGTTWLVDQINFNQDSPTGIGNIAGDLPIPGIPGTTGSTDNIAAEFTAWLDLQPGAYTLIVNSDDGFTASFGDQPLDYFARQEAGSFNGGRGAADSPFDIVVSDAGLYPFRLSWWEGGGGANVEFVMLDSAGQKILVNDGTPESIVAYPNATATEPYVRWVSPFPDATGISADTSVVAQLVDGTVTVNEGTVAMTRNGDPVSLTFETINGVRYATAASTEILPPLSVQNIVLSFDDSDGGSHTRNWSFTVADYQTLDAGLAMPLGSLSASGHLAQIYQVDPAFDLGLSGATLNTNEVTEDILAGLYGPNIIGPEEFPAPGVEVVGPAGLFNMTAVINLSEDGSDQGSFTIDDLFPGIPGGTDNFTAEFLSWYEFTEAGYYTLAVNSDDNFRMMEGHGPGTVTLTVNAPAGEAGQVLSIPSVAGADLAGIGAPLPVPGITSDLVVADPILADTPLNNAAEVAGKIVLIKRGAVSFSQKVLAAQDAGAIGVIVGNGDANITELPILMGGDATGITIPAVMVSTNDGDRLAAAAGVNVTLAGESAKILGQFGNGRGPADTTFGVSVPAPGLYPIRTIFKEGGGGSAVEIFSVNAAGTKILINDEFEPNAIRAFRPEVVVPTRIVVSNLSRENASGNLSLEFLSNDGSGYVVEASTDLQDWVNVTMVTASAAQTTVPMTLTEVIAAFPPEAEINPDQIFFRVSEQ